MRGQTAAAHESGRDARLSVEVHLEPHAAGTLAADVRRGLTLRPKQLPPKHFYDELGSKLFDRICDTPEYYQTRTEYRLLEQVAARIVSLTRPTHVVELGSGAARKTRVLLDALGNSGLCSCYVPFDVSESMLRNAATALLEEYPWLEVRGIVGDYERHLGKLPSGERRLFVFLGSTIGNFDELEARAFLKALRQRLHPGDALLLGLDLVKDARVLHAAYNDAQGITAEFNKNVLGVINRELGADFELEQFEHVAFFEPALERIEMHLLSTRDQIVRIGRLGLSIPFERGELMRTEISRKFTEQSARGLLGQAGLELRDWFVPENRYFGLALAVPTTS